MSANTKRGQVLAGVLFIVVAVLIIIPAVLKWTEYDARWAVKEQKATTAFNLSEAAVDRGVWKLKISTGTWAAAAAGIPVPGYNFDVTYTDVPGGTYRIRLSSGPGTGQVSVIGEGRDGQRQESRAIQVAFSNTAIPGSLITGGVLTYAGAFEAHWGPVLAHNNIVISGNAATEYFPRKFSKQTVQGTMGQPRDTNGLTPPNTDNVEWWSGYEVPDLPVLDFATMRASAAANGTLNYYNVNASSTGHVLTGYAGGTGAHSSCKKPTGNWTNHANHFHDSNHHPKSKQNLIWYYDSDLVLTGTYSGSDCHRIGLWGTLIVRGNLTIGAGDCYAIYQATVPTNAWQEYTRIKSSQYDSSTSNEYPADNGLRASRSTFNLGGCSSGCSPVSSWSGNTWTGGPSSGDTDVAIRGFVYVGGNLTIIQQAKGDFYGAIWVVGNVTNQNTGERSLVFYDSNLSVPTLNVVLVQQSWQEVSPSNTAWP